MATKTAVAKKSASAGALVTQDMSKELEDLRARLTAPTGNRIKMDNKTFKFPNGDVAESIDAVIVDFVYMNKYYEGSYDPNNIVPPNCFALNPVPNELVPSSNAPDIQSQVGCAGCAMNQFGTNGKGKACQNRVLIALLPADATMETPMMILDISPTALKPFSAYVSAVARSLQRPPYGVITKIEFNQAVKWDVPVFGDPQLIDDVEFIEMIRARRQEARDMLLVEPDVTAIQAANDARPKAKGLMAPKKAAVRR